MSEPNQTPKQQAAEAAAIRRRWITLGEIVAVAALVISGLTFWNSYSERTAAEAERAAERAEEQAAEAKAAERSQTLLLSARASRSGDLALAPTDSGKVIQSLTILFPTPLDTNPVDAVIEPRIEAGWIDEAVEDLDREGSSGDLRLPVAITTRFVSDGETYSDTAIYDIGYRLDSGVLDTDAELQGLALIERARAEEAQARLDAVWKARQ